MTDLRSPLVAVVTLNWNGWQDTSELLSSLDCATYEPLLIIVIDNASTDDSVPQIKHWFAANNVAHSVLPPDSMFPTAVVWGKQYLLLQSTTNLGFCAGNNLGMEWAVKLGADHILILNNDTVVSPSFLEPMVEVAADDNVGLVGGIITYCQDPQTIWWAGGTFNYILDSKRLLDRQPLSDLTQSEPYETDWISGCMMMIPTNIYSAFGGYEEEYFIWSEEWDYSLMLRAAGYKLLVAPQSRICHKVGRSLGVMKPLNYYYGVRNNMLLKHKYLPGWLWAIFLLYYLPNRALRFAQLYLQGRRDLTSAGLAAINDSLHGRTGKWQRQAS